LKNAASNTGKGGGGASVGAGGLGGSGIVILAVPTTNFTGPSAAPGASVSNPGSAPGMTVLTYPSGGSYTA
jgi:hypothetical protein